jgi:hypothetical protein
MYSQVKDEISVSTDTWIRWFSGWDCAENDQSGKVPYSRVFHDQSGELTHLCRASARFSALLPCINSMAVYGLYGSGGRGLHFIKEGLLAFQELGRTRVCKAGWQLWRSALSTRQEDKWKIFLQDSKDANCNMWLQTHTYQEVDEDPS